MVQIYRKTKTSETLKQVAILKAGSWIELIEPTQKEITFFAKKLNLPREFLSAPLDEDERSRIDAENGIVLIILRIPYLYLPEKRFTTLPMGVILTPSHTVTICLTDNQVLSDFRNNVVKTFYTTMKTRFFLQLFRRITYYYVHYLDQVENTIKNVEKQLLYSFRNEEVVRFLALQKSLVYFNTALIANGNVLERILKGTVITLYEEDQELLDDIRVENRQAQETVSIYTNILASTMDAYTSIISNNLNVVVKFLTSVTILLSIPTIVASYYGMNVSLPFQAEPWAFSYTLLITLVLMVIAIILFHKKGLL